MNNNGNCHSKRHYWTDSELAQYCCNPEYKEVRDTTRKGLENLNAVAIRPIANGLMFAGWVRKERET